MFPEAKNEYGFGYQYFSTIMAWRKGAKEPQNFTEFFDTKAFPGKRTLPDYPAYLLPPPARLAAGGVGRVLWAAPAAAVPPDLLDYADALVRAGIVLDLVRLGALSAPVPPAAPAPPAAGGAGR